MEFNFEPIITMTILGMIFSIISTGISSIVYCLIDVCMYIKS